MSEKSKATLTPSVWFNHDVESYNVQIELPGVAKEDIELSVSEQSLCIKGMREDADLLGCWYLAHGDRSMKKPLKGKSIPVE